jgi:hypothetical protein
MSDPIIYVPILKGKQGEFGALRLLAEKVRLKIMPCIEVPPAPYDFKNQRPKITIDRHLATVADYLRRSWGHLPFFLDVGLLPPEARTSDGQHPVDKLFDVCNEKGLRPVPVSAPHRDAAHEGAVATRASANGVCLRLPVDELLNGDAQQVIKSLLASVKITERAKVDIILDLGFIMESHVTAIRNGVLSVLSNLPSIAEWRSVAIGGCSFPENLIGLVPDKITAFSRAEWLLWKGILLKQGGAARLPIFGDYAIQHPVQKEIDQRVVGPSASVRYTTEEQWLVFRGRGVRTPKSGGLAQYKKLSAEVIAHADYSGKNFSLGDHYIYDCARGAVPTGNMPLWRSVGTNHHIKYVSHQVSTALGSAKLS